MPTINLTEGSNDYIKLRPEGTSSTVWAATIVLGAKAATTLSTAGAATTS